MKNLLKSANKYELFEIYEMLMEDYYHRQRELIDEQIKNYINGTYIDIRYFAKEVKNVFYVND